jgi:imidazolonepropionase-like amidohydrolase
MKSAGVKIAAGSDIAVFMSRPARCCASSNCSRRPVSHGVIVAAAEHSAGKIGKSSTVGTITPGSIAEAALLDADPLESVAPVTNSAHRTAVVRRGRLVPLGGSS